MNVKENSRWISLCEHIPEKGQYCYISDGKNKAVGVWLNDFLVLRGKVSKPKAWKPFFKRLTERKK